MGETRILIVEDEAIVARDAQDVLESAGYTVPAIALSGEEALAQAAETEPDLVLMDIKLEGELDGVGVAEEIHTRFDVPVVYLTAYADDETLRRARLSGPFGYVVKPFDERELCSTVEMALCRHRTERRLHQRTAQLEALHDISLAITAQLELDELLQEIAEQGRRLLDVAGAGVCLVDETEGNLELVVSRGYTENRAGTRLAPGEGIAGKVLESGESMRVDDYTHWEGRSPGWKDKGITGALSVPLKCGGRVVGTLGFEAIGVQRTFDEQDVWLATLFANQAAIAIENARLYEGRARQEEELRDQERFLTLLNDLTRAALETPDLPAMLQTLADQLGNLFGADGCYLTLWDDETQTVKPMAAYGEWRDNYQSFSAEPGEETITASVLRAGSPLPIEDVYDTPHLSERIAEMFPTRSVLALPLIASDEKLGAALVAFEEPHPFTPEEVARGEQAADQIALAVAKATLVEELRESEERFRSVVSQSADGIALTNEQGRIVEWNETLERISGLPAEQVLGRPVWDVMASITTAGPLPRRDRLQAAVREATEKGREDWRGQTMERDLRRPDGTHRTVHLMIFPIQMAEGYLMGCIVHDITERKRAEETLRRRDAILEAVSFAAEKFMEAPSWEENLQIVLKRLGRATEVSRVYVFENEIVDGGTVLTSQRYEWAAPRIASQIDNPDLQGFPFQASGFARWEETLSQGQPIHGHVREFPPGEYEVLSAQDILSIVIVPIFVGQAWWGFMGFDECTMEREWSLPEMDALKAAAGTLGAAIEREEMERQLRQQKKLAALGQLAGGVAHDFNNRLASIVLYAQMGLRRRDLPPTLQNGLETILEESHRAADLVQQILDFARSAMLDTEPLSLVTLVREAETLLRRTLPQSIRLVTEVTSHPCTVQADPNRIHQALMNLALNARDAMPEGGELRVGVKRVAVAPGEAPPLPDMPPGAYARLTVADTGTGMSEEAQEHLFEPFFTTKEVGKGTGLGLAQVHGIVKQHQGFIDVDTATGKGTTFTIFLPLVEDEGETAESEDAPLQPGDVTILVIEDAEQLRRAIQAGLESLGYQVITVASGREALETAPLEDVDLVLTDVVMPRMGSALLRELQARAPEPKVVAMTGHIMDTRELQAAGFADVLLKPFSIQDLGHVVRGLLD